MRADFCQACVCVCVCVCVYVCVWCVCLCLCVTNFCRWIKYKAVAYGPADLLVCFFSQTEFHFLLTNLLLILQDQSMFLASAEITLTTPLFDENTTTISQAYCFIHFMLMITEIN